MKRKILLIALCLLPAWPMAAETITDVPSEPRQTEKCHSKHTAEYIKTRLQLIYALVFNSLETGRTSLSDYFFSDEFRALYRTAEEVTPEGEVGYYDFDPWLRAQEFDQPEAEVSDVHDIKMNSAVADVVVRPMKDCKSVRVRVRLRYEHGDWFISNFDDDLNGLKQYINRQ